MVDDLLTVFFGTAGTAWLVASERKIDRSMSIDAEIAQVGNCRNSLLKSKAQFSDGSGAVLHGMVKEFVSRYQYVTVDADNRVGVKGSTTE
jgi:hypothetical protein